MTAWLATPLAAAQKPYCLTSSKLPTSQHSDLRSHRTRFRCLSRLSLCQPRHKLEKVAYFDPPVSSARWPEQCYSSITRTLESEALTLAKPFLFVVILLVSLRPVVDLAPVVLRLGSPYCDRLNEFSVALDAARTDEVPPSKPRPLCNWKAG